MSLLKIFAKMGSILSINNGKTPKPNNTPKLNPATLKGSVLDLDGITPKKYTDNLPK
jgi:hypothetical protein